MRPLSKFLKMAVVAGVEKAVRLHIDRGDDLNARDDDGLTPLMLSAVKNRAAICRLLLDAGADTELHDPSGNRAIEIAIAAGSHECAAVLGLVTTRDDELDETIFSSFPRTQGAFDPGADLPTDLTYFKTKSFSMISTSPTAQEALEGVAEPQSINGYDISGWEPEVDKPPPDEDLSVAHAAGLVQATISQHEPIDSSMGWDDVDVYLPESSLPLARLINTETRERLRLLLLRAVREGSVPRLEVEDISIDEDGSANYSAEILLTMVINDLGAEVDERFEYVSATDNFEVFVNPEETTEEEEIIAATLAYTETLASHHTSPLYLYQREFQRHRLIDAREEVALGQAMENALESALSALATWPRGIDLTLAAGNLVKDGQLSLTWVSSLAKSEVEADSEPSIAGRDVDDEAVISDEEDVENASDEPLENLPVPGGHLVDFLIALNQLESMLIGSLQECADRCAVRTKLSALKLNSRFLLELARTKDDSNPAQQYKNSMEAFQCARERMTIANLKLAFFIAKKYRYSGEPLDDLAQEGNIGLLKAVERYDWRRGFKFSTYATWWIRQQIGRHIADKSRTIRIPVHIHEKVQRLYRETLEFESRAGRTPELNEIAAELDMPSRKVAALQRLPPEPMSIHELPIDELIAIEAQSGYISPDPLEIVTELELPTVIDQLLRTLNTKEEKILRLRFGIGVEDALTLEEVGLQYGVTRERIRQIEAKALKKLKHPSRRAVFAQMIFDYPMTYDEDHNDDDLEAKIPE
jgi:RNA polymerase primary sigma factor